MKNETEVDDVDDILTNFGENLSELQILKPSKMFFSIFLTRSPHHTPYTTAQTATAPPLVCVSPPGRAYAHRLW